AVTFNSAGAQTVTASSGAFTRTSNACAVSATGPGPAVTCALSNLPGSVAPGQAFSAHVKLLDSASQVATGYLGTVAFTSSDGAAALPGGYDFTGTDSGAHQFSGTFNTAGSKTITVSDSTASVSATSGAVTVSAPASGTQLVYTDPAAGGKVRLVK